MRSAMLGLALLGAAAMGTSAQAANPSNEQSLVRPVYWDGGYCGPRCQEHRSWRHERWEARRHYWHHRQWEGRSYGYYAPPRSYGYYAPPRY
jgi:hypothetical protein